MIEEVVLRWNHGIQHHRTDALRVVPQGLQREVGAVGDAVQFQLSMPNATRRSATSVAFSVLLKSAGSQPSATIRSRQARTAAPEFATATGSAVLRLTDSARNWSISGQASNGSDFQVPRWSMKMTSRSEFHPAWTRCAALSRPLPPGPPARYTIGSGAGFADVALILATAIRIFFPLGCSRFCGTVRYPQSNSGPKSMAGTPG